MDDIRIELLSNRIDAIELHSFNIKTLNDNIVQTIKTLNDKLDVLEKEITLIRNHLKLF
jgi:hypothetical protein